jgi:hypothetical protein
MCPSPPKGQRAKRQTMVGFESSEKFEDTKGVIKPIRIDTFVSSKIVQNRTPGTFFQLFLDYDIFYS